MKRLTKEELYSLIKKFQAGDKNSGELIILANMGLVYKFVNNLMKNPRFAATVDYDDLVQEGVLALYKAAEHFDLESGNSFSTYAYYWLKAFLYRYLLRNITPVTIPFKYGAEAYNYIKKARDEDELDEEKATKELGWSNPKIFRDLKNALNPIYINATLSMDKNREIEYFLGTEDQAFEEVENCIEVEKYLSFLTEEEKELIYLHYYANIPHRIIGKMKGVSKQRIHQKLQKIFSKIRRELRGANIHRAVL